MSQSTLSLAEFSVRHIPANPEPFSRINRIPIQECGDPFVDLRVTNTELLIGEKCLPFVRSRIAGMLREASSLLPEGVVLKVGSALRTLDMQAEMYWSNFRRIEQEHPNWPTSALRRYCNKRWAPPDVKAPPGHCTGGAVDVKLCKADGTDLDHSSPIEDGWKSAPTAFRGLSEEAAENRRLLAFIMHSAGFSNCRDEYWHWSYGDSAWAVRVGAPIAIFGLAQPPDLEIPGKA